MANAAIAQSQTDKSYPSETSTPSSSLDFDKATATPAEGLYLPAQAFVPAKYPLTLDEAIRISLGNADFIRILAGNSVVGSGANYEVAITEARLRAAKASFDPRLTAELFGNWIDKPPTAVFGPGLMQPAIRHEAGFVTGLAQPLKTGGQAKLAYNPTTGFLYIPHYTGSNLNPLYSSNVELSLTQPLLRGAGRLVNTAPILIAGLRNDQSALDVQAATLGLVRSTIEAYWDLYSAHIARRAVHEAIPIIEEVVRIEEERFRAERNIRADVARARVQLYNFRQEEYELDAAVIEREIRLRNLAGMAPEDDFVLVPINMPFTAPVIFDRPAIVESAFRNRPDLQRQQRTIEAREIELAVARNSKLPQLDMRGLYRSTGNGERLDDALRQVGGKEFLDWEVGLALSTPLGQRAAKANLEAAQWQLERDKAALRQAIHSAQHQIVTLMVQIERVANQVQQAQRRVDESNLWMESARIRYENPPPANDSGDWLLYSLFDYQTAIRARVDAQTDLASLLARYNSLMAQLEEERGVLLNTWEIYVHEIRTVPLPQPCPPQTPAGPPANTVPGYTEPIGPPPPRPRSGPPSNPPTTPSKERLPDAGMIEIP